MSNNTDPIDSSYYQSLIYMHVFVCDMASEIERLPSPNPGILEYIIRDENESQPALFVKYDSYLEVMVITSYIDNVRCVLDLPEAYLKYKIDKMNLSNLIYRLIEFEFIINNEMSIYYTEDFKWDFNAENIGQNRKLLKLLLDLRYAAIQAKKFYQSL